MYRKRRESRLQGGAFKSGSAGVAARPSWWKKNVQVQKVQIVQIFLNLIVYPQTKLRGTKTGLICSGSTSELFNEPWLRKNKNGERKQFQPTAWPRNNRTPQRFIINATQ